MARRPGTGGGLPPAGRGPWRRLRRGRTAGPVPARTPGRRAAVARQRHPGRRAGRHRGRQVCVGSSVNSSYEDLATVAAALRGRRIAPEIQLTVTPGSRQILDTIGRSGVYQDLLAAGARMLEPICGPCIGIGQAPIRGRPSLRTFNRNFPGRSGTAEDAVYLCSPATAAASALTGVITDPQTMDWPPLRPAAPPDT